jgi:hypothetical protein
MQPSSSFDCQGPLCARCSVLSNVKTAARVFPGNCQHRYNRSQIPARAVSTAAVGTGTDTLGSAMCGNTSRGTKPGEVDTVSLSFVEEDLLSGEVDDVGKPGVVEPAGDLVEGMSRHISGSIPVERVAHADLGIGVHGDADGGQVQGDAQSLDQTPSTGHQLSLPAADGC